MKTKYANYHGSTFRRVQTTVEEVRVRIPTRVWLVFVLLFIANIYIAVSSATYGTQVLAVERRMKEVSEDNKEFMEAMVAEQSIVNIADKAEELGLIRPEQVVYLDAPTSLTAVLQ